jgi:Secretion system C-terminal sorting domain
MKKCCQNHFSSMMILIKNYSLLIVGLLATQNIFGATVNRNDATSKDFYTAGKPCIVTFNNLYDTICSNDYVVFNNDTLNVTGLYLDTLMNNAGCDSIITLHLLVNASPVLTVYASPSVACFGSSVTLVSTGATVYTYNGVVGSDSWIAAASVTNYTITGANAQGCTADTIITISVNMAVSNIALTMPNNSSSNAGFKSTAQMQADGMMLNFFDANCSLIATLNDATGGNVLGLTTAQVTVEPNVITCSKLPYVSRWYHITPKQQGAAIVTLYLTQNDFDNYNAAATTWPQLPTSATDAVGMANVRITKINGVLGVDSGIVITPVLKYDSNNKYWSATFAVDSFSQFYFHSVNALNAPLNIELTKFTGYQIAMANLLQWTTISETNNAFFNVLYSTHAQSFEIINTVATKATNGTSALPLDYEIMHNNWKVGHNYYQLQNIDVTGKTTNHTKVIDLFRTQDGSLVKLYPNPTSGNLQIEFIAPRSQALTIKVLDISGRVVRQIETNTEKGINTFKLDITNLANGIYTVQLLQSGIISYNGLLYKQ